MTNGDDAVAPAFARFESWMFEHALPFWSTHGRDPDGYGFVEHLTPTAVPAPVAYKRVRVQARQIYVFSHAALLGFDGGAAAAADGYAFLTEHACLGGGRWASRLGRQGGVLDPAADLYDLAFVLFALAWYARLTGSQAAIDRAHATLDWIHRHMRGPKGGFLNALPAAGWRQQNPHMHLLEAVLALYETTRDATFLATAAELVALFGTAFFDAASGTLGEFFRDDWSRADGDAGSHVEPGHHYEWVWLLDRYERLTGGTAGGAPGRLYDFANAHGVRPGTGLVVDVVDRAGSIRDGSFRLWPQTEAIKAHLVMAERACTAPADPVFGRRMVTCIDNFLTVFVQADRPSVWMDHFSAEGLPKSERIPSSSFYHIFMAFGELARRFRPGG